MLSNKKSYDCSFCGKTFRQKFNYDRHILPCEFFSKSKKEQDFDIDNNYPLPTQREMFSLMQHMVLRIDKLEKDNNQLRHLNRRRKIKVLDYLNGDSIENPIYSFTDWVRNVILPDVKNHLETVFEKDLLTGMTELLVQNINNKEKMVPIASFQCDKNIYYIYDLEGEFNSLQWFKLDSHEMDQYLCRMTKQFIYDFNNIWHRENEEKIRNNEDWEEKSVHYYTKILGGTRMKDQTLYRKIREFVYQATKLDERNLCVD